MATEINRKPERNPESESILERIPRLWATGKLYYMDDRDGMVKPFPKPEIEGQEK